jgi:acyl-CoA thioesterase
LKKPPVCHVQDLAGAIATKMRKVKGLQGVQVVFVVSLIPALLHHLHHRRVMPGQVVLPEEKAEHAGLIVTKMKQGMVLVLTDVQTAIVVRATPQQSL